MTHTDFIEVYENVIPLDMCEALIQDFNTLDTAGLVSNRQEAEKVVRTAKDTSTVFSSQVLTNTSAPLHETRVALSQAVTQAVWNHVNLYINKYAVLTSDGGSYPMSIYTQKIQRTEVGGGYHIWHYEANGRTFAGRVLLYILYLNDVEEGGETEFLYIPKRVKPKAGSLLLVPCSFTHTHRGNPPLSGVKYIVNGWLEF